MVSVLSPPCQFYSDACQDDRVHQSWEYTSLCLFRRQPWHSRESLSSSFCPIIRLYAFSQQHTSLQNQSALRNLHHATNQGSAKVLGVFSIVNILNFLLTFLTNSFPQNGVNYLWGREKLSKLIKKCYIAVSIANRHWWYTGIHTFLGIRT